MHEEGGAGTGRLLSGRVGGGQRRGGRQIVELVETHDGHDGAAVGLARLLVQLEVLLELHVAHDGRGREQYEGGADEALGIELAHRVAQALTLEVEHEVDLGAARSPLALVDVRAYLLMVARAEEEDLLDLVVEQVLHVVVEERAAADERRQALRLHAAQRLERVRVAVEQHNGLQLLLLLQRVAAAAVVVRLLSFRLV